MKTLIYIIVFTSFTCILSASINLIDTVPQTSQLGHANTSWNDEHYGNPSENIPFIDPPKANVTGDANVSFPFSLPEARQGLSPLLILNYDSGSGSSWTGIGWNLSFSSFTLDTRWGVPRFNNEIESEIYLFNGEQLGPVFHRTAEYPREEERVFHLRQEEEFQKIIRHGNSPENYWWEVADKNGTKNYYGGLPELGSISSAILRNDEGKITEWKLVETRDPNHNFVRYEYQTTNGIYGRNIYPKKVFYNGHGDALGNYSIEFISQDSARPDITFSARTSMLIAEEYLLEQIIIKYKDELIRTYNLTYELGVFSKSLLTSIAEYDSNGDLFYEYRFDYHDDIRVNGEYRSYSEEEEWEVANDNVSFGSITGDLVGFDGTPTILGGAKATSTGGNSSITIGFPSNPATKDFTAGPNGGITDARGTGLTALIDINGDGLPDKVWKEDDGIYFRANIYKENRFGSRQKIVGVEDFSLSNTFSWNLGAELNLPPVYAGFSHEEGKTKITTYFADYNGDELMDIVSEGKVYFNHLENGIPTFTQNSAETPSEVFKGAPLDPSLVEFDPNEQAMLEDQSPLHDVVRIWVAPKSGLIDILAPLHLIEDTSDESQNYQTKDGVIAMIQHENLELWRETMAENDFGIVNPNSVNSISVLKGDIIYFRLHSIADGLYDRVNWDPQIIYSNTNTELINADCQTINAYQASHEFLLSENKSVTFSKEGTVELRSKIFKTVLSDSITFRISDPINYERTFAPSEIVDMEEIISSIPVPANTEIHCTVTALSNVAWSSIEWEPNFIYTEFADGTNVNDPNGNPLISLCAPVEYEGFYGVDALGSQYTVPTENSYNIEIAVDASEINGEYTFTIKSKNNPDSIIYHHNSANNDTLTFEMNLQTGDSLFCDVYYNNPSENDTLIVNYATISNGNSTSNLHCGVYYKATLEEGLYGHLYRGWGQFVYNANDNRGDTPIMLTELMIDTIDSAQDTSIVDEGSGSTEVDGANGSDELIIVMTSDPKLMAWRGSDEFAVISASEMASSRKGQKYIGIDALNTPSGDFFTSPELITRYYSNGGFGGFQPPGLPASVGGGYTGAISWSVLDVSDMNGDRFPDLIGENSIQYSNARGGLTEEKYDHTWGTHETFSSAVSIGAGLNPGSTSPKNAGAQMGAGSNKKIARVKQRTKSSTSKARSAFESATEAVGLSANVAFDQDTASHTFLDINGDGLEDKIWADGNVAINLGYDFASIENWEFNTIRSGDARDIGGGLGINISNGSILGGVSVTSTTNGSETGFIDINADALPDLIVSSDPIIIRINTGTGFSDPITWLNEERFDEAVSIGESVNVGGTFSLIFFWIKISFNLQVFTGQGSSAVYSAFQDVNGDSFPDYISASNDDDNLTVRESNIGKSNLLKTIHYPLNATTEITYSVAGNSYGMPYSKYVLQKITVNDGISGDGIDFTESRFTYSGGNYDRHERQFYGFSNIEEQTILADTIYRKIKSEYLVDNYYVKGTQVKQSILDHKDYELRSTIFQYDLEDIGTGIDLPDSYTSRDDGMAFKSLRQKITTYREYNSEKGLNHIYFYEYDTLGNITKQIDIDESGYSRTTQHLYRHDLQNYIVDRPSSEWITSDTLLRETFYEYDEKGNKIEIKQTLNDSEFAITNMTFDEYGNIISLNKPENYKGERFTYQNTYDSEEHQYLISEIDAYGYENIYEYEYLFNSLISSTDINGNKTQYNVDEKGRASIMTLPQDIELDKSFSIKHEYNINADKPYVKTIHIDPQNDSEYITYNFQDGLYRNIQNKKEFIVHDGSSSQEVLIVSGKEIYDGLGRVIRVYQPVVESLSQGNTLNNTLDLVQPLEIRFDILDRLSTTINVDNGITDYEYLIAKNSENNDLLTVKTTDPLEVVSYEFYNLRNEIVATNFRLDNQDIWTKFIYDEISQARSIIDHFGNVSTYDYDMLGRRIMVKVPDAGTTELFYDLAGNLIERKTATIKETIATNGSIRYQYDKERLIQIDYPKNFHNKVQIHYGAPGADFNRAGRIWLQEDASGGREFYFDINGNPTKIIRTVIINRSEIYTYVSEYKTDAWNRAKEMKYPDGEILHYSYNSAGKLYQIAGTKSNAEYNYINEIQYDKFEEITRINYGNQCSESINFDSKGRTINRTLININNTSLKDDSYSYDLVDNIITRTENGSSEIGGRINETFEYDDLNRMTSGSGQWNGTENQEEYQAFFEYDQLNNLTMKGQTHTRNNNQQGFTSRFIDYKYEDQEKPTRPSEAGGRSYSYDPNGNLLLANSSTVFNFDQNIFDEENRLMGNSNNGYLSIYTYDAFGRRTIKSHGESQGVFINGAPAGFVEHTVNYQVEVSPYFTIYENDYRKHIYINKSRIATKIGTGVFQTNLGEVPQITAGNIDYKSRIQQYEQAILDYYETLGVPPGPPTLLALLGQPEINSTGLPNANSNDPYTNSPPNWPNISPPDTTGPPGSPIFYAFADITNENVEAGYNFSDGDITEELEQFFYHSDVSGNINFMTGSNGLARQYSIYFPSGELWISKTLGIDSSNFLFAGITLDHETGMYYMGEIYYDPITNIELSIDPILQNFGQSTFLQREEGNLYYDYANYDNAEISFDTEILSTSNPDPFLSNVASYLNVDFDPGDGYEIDLTKGFNSFNGESTNPFTGNTPDEVKRRRRKESLNSSADSSKKLQELADLQEAFETKNLQSPDGFEANSKRAFKELKKEAKRSRARKNKLNQRKKNNKLKTKFRL